MQPCGPADLDPISFQSFCGPDQSPETDDCIPLTRAVQIPTYNSKGEIIDRSCYDALQLAQWFARARQSLVNAFGDIDVRAVYTDPLSRIALSRAVVSTLARVPEVQQLTDATQLSADLEVWRQSDVKEFLENIDRNLDVVNETLRKDAEARRLAFFVGIPILSLFRAMIAQNEGDVYTFQDRLGLAVYYVALFWAIVLSLAYGADKLLETLRDGFDNKGRPPGRLQGGDALRAFAATIQSDAAHVPPHLRAGAQNVDAIVFNPRFDVLVDRMLHQLR